MSIKIKAKIKINIQVFPKKNDVMNKENPYRIFNASPIGDVKGLKLNNRFEFSIKGEYPYLDEDGIYDVELEELDTTKWSTNYKVLEVFNFKELKNLTRQESENILSKMASENNTKTLLDTYPNFIEKVLTEGKESIDTSKLYNIKEKKLNSYCRQINEKFKYYSIMSKFKDYELTMKECQKLCDVYKTTEDIAKAIQDNPYFVLIDVLDRNFLYEKNNGELDGVDTMLIYGKKNKEPLREDLKESEIRCEYLMLKALDDNEKNTCSTRQSGNDLWEYTKDYAPELVPLMKKVAIECDGTYYDEPTTDMAKMSTYLGEVKIAKFVNMLLENDNKLDWDWSKFTTIKDGELTEEQQELLKQICEHRIVIMDAGAGMGKSSAMMAVLQMIEHYHLTYQCMTATGKSSKRLSEQTNRPCSTIHLIKLRNGGTNATFIIVDEDSFLSVELMTMVIDCINEEDNVRVILSGDCGQIPSISAGRIIRDMIDSNKIPIVNLTKCFRFSEGGKATVSTKCRERKFYINEEDVEKDIVTYGKNKDYTFVKFNGTTEQVIDIYKKVLEKEKCKPSDIWVLTPWNIYEFGSINLSNKIQALVNPPIEGEKTFKITRDNKDIVFRENDLVLNLVNKYDCIDDNMYNEMLLDNALAKSDYQKELLSCMNGEIGKVLYIDDKVMKILFDENILVFDKNDIKNLSLAYSINIFKAQGSQNKHIITLTIPEHKKSLNSQLQYTALTRATDTVTEIGDISIMKEAVSKLGDDKRRTFLLDLLKEDSNETN